VQSKKVTDFWVKSLVAKIKVSGQAIERWCRWWQEAFAKSAFFKTERGRFKPLTIEDATLPACLLLCFEGTNLSSRLQGLLRFLARSASDADPPYRRFKIGIRCHRLPFPGAFGEGP
jgi:hypothetical protein